MLNNVFNKMLKQITCFEYLPEYEHPDLQTDSQISPLHLISERREQNVIGISFPKYIHLDLLIFKISLLVFNKLLSEVYSL